jgi:diguanylate cyclase (GGDEF)-like protein/PAS domain S-box-containing protein
VEALSDRAWPLCSQITFLKRNCKDISVITTEIKQIDIKAAVSATSRALILCDTIENDCIITFVNLAFTLLTGYEPHEAMGRNCRFLQGPDSDPNVTAEIRRAVSGETGIRREILNYRKNGDPFWNEVTIDPIRDGAGTVIGFIGVQHDVSAAHLARDGQAVAELRLQDIVSKVPGYVYRRVLKQDGTIEVPYLSPSTNRLLGIADGKMVTAQEFYRHVHPDDHDTLMRGIRRSAAELSIFNEEFRIISAKGVVRWFRSEAPPRRRANGDVVWDGLGIEITLEKLAESEAAFLAFHDSLTGLSNRVRFKNALIKSVEAHSSEDNSIGIFFVDIDAFQEINDALGQSGGDDVLRAVGGRLKKFADDAAGTVARMGGDEFAIMLPGVPDVESVSSFCAAICHDLTGPIHFADTEIAVQVCVGATIFPYPHETSQPAIADAYAELMKQADLALHAAKREGPGEYRLYSPSFDDRARIRLALRQSLQRAIAEERFELHYQPVVYLESGRIIGGEALVRWNHPELGMQRPDLFIPLAENSGLIVPLGAWIMKEAMRQSQAWKQQGIDVPRIAINVSSVQLQKPDFISVVERTLVETGADPKDFEFELTESVLIDASPEMLSVLNGVKSLGFGLTIDDFGTGHSSFKYLREFPIEKIKIDQTFVRQLVIGSSDASIIRAMIALSRSLGLAIVAEGVETAMQRDFLAEEGCAIGQGYLFSLPLAAEDFGWVLQQGVTLPMSALSRAAA